MPMVASVRLGAAAGLGLLMAGCGGGSHSAIRVTFDTDGSTRSSVVQCVESTSGACHVAFLGTPRIQGVILAGGRKTFSGVVAQVPVCAEQSAEAIATCQPIALMEGKQTIERTSSTR
jgi:hypothetical protein